MDIKKLFAEHFVLIETIVVLLLVISFLRKRQPVKPVKLKLRKKNGLGTLERAIEGEIEERVVDCEKQEKELNVFFVFNGHSFDAYEVLGVPAGASLEVVQKQYERVCQEDPENQEIHDLALQTIQKRFK